MPILKKKSEYVYAELETDLRDQILRGVPRGRGWTIW